MKPKRNPSKELVPIGTILKKSLAKFRKKYDEEMASVWDIWETVVGKLISENACPAAFKGKILIVHVSGSAYLHHLEFMKSSIIEKINNMLGKVVIEEIKFKIGPVREWKD